ncbi:hypothetical protein VTN77DRAFT_1123 [Rasamsonia byssochlamydoides]|uniref:uncharacterized protein n=1 Tax=Rasamsonia byssochlamydoides TaxID=89139 RepID=UPI0037434B79
MATVSTGQKCPPKVQDSIPEQTENTIPHELEDPTSCLTKAPRESGVLVKRTSRACPVQRRGRPKKFSQNTIDQMVHMLEESCHTLSWEQLGNAVGVGGVHLQTIRNQLINEGYCKSVACQKKWLTAEAADARVAFAVSHQSWQNEWRSVLFSSHVSFGLGPSRKAKVIINEQQRLCEGCHRNKQRGQEQHVFHCWAIVGFNHKSPLIFYHPGNICHRHATPPCKNQETTQPISPEKQFLLVKEAAGFSNEPDLRHELITQTHGESQQLSHIVSPPRSPDLNIIHGVLLFLKKRLQKRAFRDQNDLKAGILEEWNKVSIKEINKLVNSMPRRINDVIRKKGKPV